MSPPLEGAHLGAPLRCVCIFLIAARAYRGPQRVVHHRSILAVVKPAQAQADIWISLTSWNRVTTMYFSTLIRSRAQVGEVTNSSR